MLKNFDRSASCFQHFHTSAKFPRDKILNKFSEENLFNGYYPFIINGVTLGDRLDINEHTGNLYPHFDVYYEGYVNQHNKISVAKLIVMEIEKYFNNLVVSPNSSFNFIKIK
mgnify:CR=1 FL=1